MPNINLVVVAIIAGTAPAGLAGQKDDGREVLPCGDGGKKAATEERGEAAVISKKDQDELLKILGEIKEKLEPAKAMADDLQGGLRAMEAFGEGLYLMLEQIEKSAPAKLSPEEREMLENIKKEKAVLRKALDEADGGEDPTKNRQKQPSGDDRQ